MGFDGVYFMDSGIDLAELLAYSHNLKIAET